MVGTSAQNRGYPLFLLCRIAAEEHNPLLGGFFVTRRRHIHDGCTPRAEHPPRGKVPGQIMWSRVLPGSVAVVAALTVPEFSVGAGDLAGGDRFDDPLGPPAETGLDRFKRGSGAAKGPLAGVRYGSLLEVRTNHPRMVAQSRIANVDQAVISLEDTALSTALSPSQLVALPAALAAISAPPRSQANARLAETRRNTSAAADTLDKAAVYAVSVLGGYSAPPGLQAATSLAVDVTAASPTRDSLDTAAIYTASVIESFVEQPVWLPEMSAMVSGINGGDPQFAGSASPPSASPPSASQPAVVAALAATSAATSGDAQFAGSRLPPSASQPARVAAPDVTSTSAFTDIAPHALPAKLGQTVAAQMLPAVAAQPVAVVPMSSSASLASAAPSAARAIAAPKPVPVAKPTAAVPALPVATLPIATLAAAVPSAPVRTGPIVSPPQFDITSQLTARVDGKSAGAVDFAQTETGLKVRLGSIVELLGDRIEAAQIARIKASSASNTYLSLAELQAQGIPISYDPVYDEFNVGLTDTRPKAARKVHMDQITAPERGANSTGIDQVRR